MTQERGPVTGPAVGPIAPRQSLREFVEDALATAIITGEMEPGELFSAPVLAERFAVSATPVREAMINLEKRGFVEIVRNKGFRVLPVSDESLNEIVGVRLLLEPPSMRTLAEQGPLDDLPELRRLADDITSGAERGDLAAYLTADTVFHTTLISRLGNTRLTDLVAELRAQTRLPGLAGMLATEELHSSALEHLELLELLSSGDGEGAEQLMRRHISHVLGWWAGRTETAPLHAH